MIDWLIDWLNDWIPDGADITELVELASFFNSRFLQ